jgi:hypothetical protein
VLRLTLTHLTFVGASVPPASIEFGPQFTLVRGPSDTGKSFVVNAIDFMLGGSNLNEIPERDGYSTVLLGLRLADDQDVTLSRPVTGGAVGLYLSNVRTLPLPVPDELLAAKHNPRSDKNLSRYLLKQVGLDEKRVRRNARNATDTLSFRNLAHLCLVDETQMQAETPPALTGQYTTRTKEISVFKLLLQTEDDSHLIEEEEKQEKSRLDGARVEVIDRLLAELEAELSETPEVSELTDQLARLNGSIEQRSGAVSGLTNERNGVTERLRGAQDEFNAARTKLSEIAALQGRFGLLQMQYESDLRRLATIDEAGNLLDYFTPGVCAFCGAEPEHQHYNLECEGDETALHASIDAETAKTAVLRDDLLLTLNDLASRRTEVLNAGGAARDQVRELEANLQELDRQLAPQNNDLRDLLTIRRDVEKSLGLYERVADLQRMRNQIEDDVATDTKVVSVGISLAAIREFSGELSKRLKAWGYPEADSVRYDRTEQDIQAGDQFRSSHGKGVRAILHAGFTLGLAQYCFDREIAHPGFIILDSPLVTYRPPDSTDTDVPVLDNSLPKGVVEAFYRDVQMHFDGQIIVMENLDPTEALHADSVDIPFTHRRDVGRYGFFPIDVGHQRMLDAAEAPSE